MYIQKSVTEFTSQTQRLPINSTTLALQEQRCQLTPAPHINSNFPLLQIEVRKAGLKRRRNFRLWVFVCIIEL